MWTRRAWMGLAAAGLGARARAAEEADNWRPMLTLDDPGLKIHLSCACTASPRILLAGGWTHKPLEILPRGLLCVSEDGGRTWARRKPPEQPRALFSPGDETVWLLGERRLWMSTDAGWTWQGGGRPGGATGMFFLDKRHGFAFGGRRVSRTSDGGKRWARVPGAESSALPQELAWRVGHLHSDGRGWIAGAAMLPPDADQKGPDGEALSRRQRGSLRKDVLALMETCDGGGRWTVNLYPAPGTVRSLVDTDGVWTGAFLTDAMSRFPTVVARMGSARTSWQLLLREEGLDLHSLSVHGGHLLAAGAQGRQTTVRALHGDQWTERRVHYSAQSPNARFFPGPGGAPWLLLASGMILAPVR